MHEELPLVSVLIPVYNHERYVIDSLESVKNQTYKNIEIIICDDGSTDGSLEKVNTWAHENDQIKIKILYQENMGVCRTLNRLICESEGELIAICASDDLLLPSSIADRYRYLLDNTDVDAVIGDALVIDENSSVINSSAMKSLYRADFDRLAIDIGTELIFNWSVVGPTLLLYKHLYSLVGMYDETLKVEDRDFYLRCISKGKLGFYSFPVAKYRIHRANASRKTFEARVFIWRQVAISNVKNSNAFGGSKRLYLKTHRIDIFFLDKCIFGRWFLLLFRGGRIALIKALRKGKVL